MVFAFHFLSTFRPCELFTLHYHFYVVYLGLFFLPGDNSGRSPGTCLPPSQCSPLQFSRGHSLYLFFGDADGYAGGSKATAGPYRAHVRDQKTREPQRRAEGALSECDSQHSLTESPDPPGEGSCGCLVTTHHDAAETRARRLCHRRLHADK